MDGLMFLIPAAIALGAIGLAAFVWAVKTGQFDDLEGDASRILYDDEPDQDKQDKPEHAERD